MNVIALTGNDSQSEQLYETIILIGSSWWQYQSWLVWWVKSKQVTLPVLYRYMSYNIGMLKLIMQCWS